MNEKALNILAKGAILTAFGMLFSKIMSYFYRIAVARLLGPEAYGQLSIGIMIAGIAALFGGLSMHKAIKKFVPKYKTNNDFAKVKGTILSAISITIPASLIVGLFFFFTSSFIANQIFEIPEVEPIIKIFAFVPLFSRIYNIFLNVTESYNTVKYRVITAEIFQNIAQLSITLILIYIGYDVLGAVWGWFFGILLSLGLIMYYMEFKLGPILTSNVKAKYNHKELFIFSYPLVLSGSVGAILGWTDTAFLGYFMTDADVGFYNAALPTAMILLIPHRSLHRLVMPSISSMIEKKDSNITNTLKTLTRWGLITSLPLFLIMILFSSQILHLLFGAEYTIASTALQILAVGYMFNVFTGQISDYLKAEAHTKLFFKNNLINLAINVILNILLIPEYGINGAAIATTASIIVSNSLLVFESYLLEKRHPITFNFKKILFSSLISLLATYSLFKLYFKPVEPLLLIPGIILFYLMTATIFLLIKGLQKEEVAVLKKLNSQYVPKKHRKSLERLIDKFN